MEELAGKTILMLHWWFIIIIIISDPRSTDYPFISTPFPTLMLLYFWYQFIFKWGPQYMKNRKPFNLKRIIIIYNVLQVLGNSYIFYYVRIQGEFVWTRRN